MLQEYYNSYYRLYFDNHLCDVLLCYLPAVFRSRNMHTFCNEQGPTDMGFFGADANTDIREQDSSDI